MPALLEAGIFVNLIEVFARLYLEKSGVLFMFLTIILLLLAIALIILSADFAINYASQLAKSLGFSKYAIGFLVVAFISILPETLVAISSAFEGVPAFGLGTLFGSNVADLTLVFAIILLYSRRSLSVDSKIIKNAALYIGALCLPLILGINGYYSRIDGMILVLAGALFYYHTLASYRLEKGLIAKKFPVKYALLLLLSMILLLIGSRFTVDYGVALAGILHVNPAVIGLFIVGLGTTLPELFFSLKAAKNNHDGLALGDILGTVIADATIVVGIVALIAPFRFNVQIIYVTGAFMISSAIFLLYLMKTGKKLTLKEGWALALFYFLFVAAELSVANVDF